MKLIRRSRRNSAEVNAGSMADIAFLLLIFFLVTTTIVIDQGIAVKLPPWSDEDPMMTKIPSRNIFRIVVNAQNNLLVEGERAKVSDLKSKIIEFITNPNQSANLARSPKSAIISLQNDRGTSYETYIDVYNELKAAYNTIWNTEAQARFGFNYEDLERKQQKLITKDFPLVISEAEPINCYGDASIY
ncbi:MAG: ExbD/TolR family protein [Saprospiraceae bacterium]